ncbi:hypothetical protein SAMN05880582_102173 [Rhizobium sp. RU20A]|nr:hypothetical protein SAMN05880582_102173 [Rhizobium sp. RU20A]
MVAWAIFGSKGGAAALQSKTAGRRGASQMNDTSNRYTPSEAWRMLRTHPRRIAWLTA